MNSLKIKGSRLNSNSSDIISQNSEKSSGTFRNSLSPMDAEIAPIRDGDAVKDETVIPYSLSNGIENRTPTTFDIKNAEPSTAATTQNAPGARQEDSATSIISQNSEKSSGNFRSSLSPMDTEIAPIRSDLSREGEVTYSLGDTNKPIDKYSQKQYNDFGWARDSEAITKNELDDMYAKIQIKGSLKKFPQSGYGEAIIEVNDDPYATLGTDNVFVFVKGTKNNPQISKVVRFQVETDTEMEIIKEKLYERGSFSYSYYSFLRQEGLAREYSKKSAIDYNEYAQKTRSGSGRGNRNEADRHRGFEQDGRGTFEQAQSNGIAPIKEASSEDGVFFDGETVKQSLSLKDAEIAPVRSDLSREGEVTYSLNKGRETYTNTVDERSEDWYNGNELFTTTDDYANMVAYEDRHDFNRWLANKTTDMAEGEHRNIVIYCGRKVYFFEADGYMQGRLLRAASVKHANIVKQIREVWRNGNIKNVDTVSSRADAFALERRRTDFNRDVFGDRPRESGYDGFPVESSGSESRRDYGGSGEHYQIDNTEIDLIVKELRKQFEFTDYPLESKTEKEASSEDGVFFDGETVKQSLSVKDAEIAPVRDGYSVYGDDVRVKDPSEVDFAPLGEDIIPKQKEIMPSEEQRDANIRDVAKMGAVYTVDDSKLNGSGKRFTDIYGELFAEWGENIHSEVFGDISTKNSSVRSEIRHGSTSEKIAAVEAIPSVIENGKIVDWIEKHPGSYRIVVAAPIRIGNTPYIMGVMLQRDSQYQRLYLHDVVIEKETSTLSQDDLITTGSHKESDSLFTTTILQKILNVKKNFRINKEIAPIKEASSEGGVLFDGKNPQYSISDTDQDADSYDGIFDTGGKDGGEGHTEAIPFYSEQIKSVDNRTPTSNDVPLRDLRLETIPESDLVPWRGAPTQEDIAPVVKSERQGASGLTEEIGSAVKQYSAWTAASVFDKNINGLSPSVTDRFCYCLPRRFSFR